MRSGGGSNPGERRGGRKKGVPNKKTAEQQAAIAASGETPLEFMLRIMRAPIDPGLEPKDYLAATTLQMEAARSAAPYVHPKLASIEVGNKGGEAFKVALQAADASVL